MESWLKWVKNHPRRPESPLPVINKYGAGYPNFTVGAANTIGRGKESMEDRHIIMPSFGDTLVIGVFDGYQGVHAAEFCETHLYDTLAAYLGDEDPPDYEQALKNAFLKLDTDFQEWAKGEYIPNRPNQMTSESIFYHACGTTAIVTVMTPENLYVANAGNSRCFLSRAGNTIALSRDHSALSDPLEAARVQRCKDSIMNDNKGTPGPLPGDDKLTRMIGCHYLKEGERCKHLLSAQADVTQVRITNEDEFMVMMSEGIWKNMDIQTLMSKVSARIAQGARLQDIAKEIILKCLEGKVQENMTIIIVACKGNRGEEELRSLIETRLRRQKWHCGLLGFKM